MCPPQVGSLKNICAIGGGGGEVLPPTRGLEESCWSLPFCVATKPDLRRSLPICGGSSIRFVKRSESLMETPISEVRLFTLRDRISKASEKSTGPLVSLGNLLSMGFTNAKLHRDTPPLSTLTRFLGEHRLGQLQESLAF